MFSVLNFLRLQKYLVEMDCYCFLIARKYLLNQLLGEIFVQNRRVEDVHTEYRHNCSK
jgi:hypothetical protein